MASPNKKDVLLHKLTDLSARQKWLAIAYYYVRNQSDAEDVLHDAYIDLEKQNIDNVKDIDSFIKQVITNKAKSRFKANVSVSKISIEPYSGEKEMTSTLFTQLEFEEVMKAIKQHRNDLDFRMYEMHSKGFSYEEIATETGKNAGMLRRRMYNLHNWLKGFFKNER